MRALPLPDLPGAYLPPRPKHPDDPPSYVLTPPDVREQIIAHLAEKYVDMARASDASPAKSDIESQFAVIKAKATELLLSLERLNMSAVAALNLAMGKGSYPPLRRVAVSTATMVIDPRPKALGDIMGRLEVLIDAASQAELPTAKSVRGRQRKSDALETAKAAARDYNFLTCLAPNRSKNKDGFLDFLAAIFKALNRLNDSVDNLAKQACEWWRNDCAREDRAELEKLLANPPNALDGHPPQFSLVEK
jgi:hypothetical protein